MPPKKEHSPIPSSGTFVVESFKAAGLKPVSPEEARRLSLDNSRSENREAFEPLETRERESLKKFFGKDIDVPPVPTSISPEQYEKWKEMKFELHYLPEESMTEDKDYPGWKKKPTQGVDLLKEAKESTSGLSPNTVTLTGAWVLVDTREKPTWGDNAQYPDDADMEQAIQELRTSGVIAGDNAKGDRFRISWEELHKDEVKAKLAEILGVDPDQIRLPRAIEFNFLGNAYYTKWGDTNSWEWLEEAYSSRLLLGGFSDGGGLSNVDWSDAGYRDDSFGFRPLIVFSS